MDGTDITELYFGPPLPWTDDKCTLSVALLGHVVLTTSKRDGTGKEKSVFPEGYDVGSLLLFTGEYLSCRQIDR